MQPIPEDWDRAVAVVAHPDDLEYGVASAVARWTEQGKHVSYVLATRGEAGIAGMSPDKVGPLRVEEERRSAAVVGVSEVEFLDHQDGLVEYGIALRRDLATAFRRLRPEVVIGMSFDLTWGEEGPVNHADHRVVGLAVLDACRDAANEWVFPEAGPRCDTIRDAYVSSVGNPTHFVDVTGTIDAGVASLREHRAYIEGLGRDFDPDEFLKNMAGYVGLGAGCEYAVAFRRYPMGLALCQQGGELVLERHRRREAVVHRDVGRGGVGAEPNAGAELLEVRQLGCIAAEPAGGQPVPERGCIRGDPDQADGPAAELGDP
jgi:LmbE family N-acetylglucosaminyl deacetylase